MRVLLIALVLALALVGAGCGGDDDEASSETDTSIIDTVTDETTTDEETTDEETTTAEDDETVGDSLDSAACQELGGRRVAELARRLHGGRIGLRRGARAVGRRLQPVRRRGAGRDPGGPPDAGRGLRGVHPGDPGHRYRPGRDAVGGAGRRVAGGSGPPQRAGVHGGLAAVLGVVSRQLLVRKTGIPERGSRSRKSLRPLRGRHEKR